MGRILKREACVGAGTGGPHPDLPGEARRQAAAIVAAARDEAERIRSAAREEVRAEARAAREARDAEEQGERSRIRAGDEEVVVALALAVAARVLALAVEDPRAARETARRALEQARGCERLLLRCHPGDEAPLRSADLRPAGALAALTIEPDPSVGRGGVLLETEAGTVDARVERQLERLAHGLVEAG